MTDSYYRRYSDLTLEELEDVVLLELEPVLFELSWELYEELLELSSFPKSYAEINFSLSVWQEISKKFSAIKKIFFIFKP